MKKKYQDLIQEMLYALHLCQQKKLVEYFRKQLEQIDKQQNIKDHEQIQSSTQE